MEIITSNLNDIAATAKEILSKAEGRPKICFYGDIGAGKTTLIKAICAQLGVEEAVTSPTFALVNEYALGESPTLVRHLDLYRLKNLEEAIDIGIEDFLYDPHYCFIEWPQLIEPILPANALKINLQILNDSMRKIIFL